jgi:predicted helicase
MTIDQQVKLAEQYTYLWRGLMTTIGIPEQDTILFWAGKYEEAVIVQAFNRTARKARRLRDSAEPMTLLDAVKYATSVMTHEMLNERQFPQDTGVAA